MNGVISTLPDWAAAGAANPVKASSAATIAAGMFLIVLFVILYTPRQ
jgi:hypothetical protein